MNPFGRVIILLAVMALLVPASSRSQQTQRRVPYIAGHRLPAESRPHRLGVEANLLPPSFRHIDSTPLPPDRQEKASPNDLISIIDTTLVYSILDTTRHTYAYNTRGKITLDHMQKMEAGIWVDSARYTYTYDANGKKLSDLSQVWSDGQWVNSSRYARTFDTNGNLVAMLNEVWSNGQWINSSRITFTRDVRGNVLNVLGENWSNGQWVNDYRYTSTYDADGNEVTFLDEQWSNGNWINFARITGTYDSHGNVLNYLYEQWSNGQWVMFMRGSSTYDANGNRLSDLFEDWSNGQWMNSSRRTYTYDGHGNELTLLNELWSNGQWVNFFRITWTYDADGYIHTFSSELCEYGQWMKSDGTFWGLGDSAGNYYNFFGYRVEFIRHTIVTGVTSGNGPLPSSFALGQNYPNPFNPSSEVRYQLPQASFVSLKVFNLLGQEVQALVNTAQQPGEQSVQIDGNGLASGVYFYRLEASSTHDPAKRFIQTRKMVLVR